MNLFLAELLAPHVLAIALISARLVPVSLFCPLLGGPRTPVHVKLALTLALASCIHFAGGVRSPLVDSAANFGVMALVEASLGVTIGLLSSLPFDSARIGGRFIDMLRGSSAEATLPATGTKEAATGEGLFHLLLAMAAVGGVLPLVVAALFRTYALFPIGTFSHSESLAMSVTGWVGTSFSAALAIGAPIAALALMVDMLVGLASRAANGLNVQESSAPLKLLGGGALLWLALGVIAERLMAGVVGGFDQLLGTLGGA